MNNINLHDRAIGAMLGAACGDALGWPNEFVNHANIARQQNSGIYDFKEWKRKTGGRYYPHEEIIKAGEYSDDTQLILCLGRSLLKGNEWWSHWTKVELPFWMLYERGGGRATKRSAEAWICDAAPWSSVRDYKDVKDYFEAGGNGVAMRILPHVLYCINSKDYNAIATNIMRDGITTHGHPRALLGALSYGYALWKTILKSETLGYGEIIEDVLDNKNIWSVLPTNSEYITNWLQSANNIDKNYDDLWTKTVQEIESLFLQSKKEIKKGTLAIDDEVLESLNCFDKKINGAGTIASAASVFLASRYAPDPIHGIAKAAFSFGADTDTLASMTGALLGGICGSVWLSKLKNKVQDAAYLEKMSKILINHEIDNINHILDKNINKTSLDNWNNILMSKQNMTDISLLDGRKCVVNTLPDHVAKTGRYRVQFRKVICDDSQSLYFKKISKGDFKSDVIDNVNVKNAIYNSTQAILTNINVGTKLPVRSIENAIFFYKDVIGLNIKRQSNEVVAFDQGLIVVPINYGNGPLNKYQFKTILCVEVFDVNNTLKKVTDNKYMIISPIDKWGNSSRLFFRCLDPDENVVEVFARETV